MSVFRSAILVLPLLAGAASAQYTAGAALVDPGLVGATQYDGWIGLGSGNYPGFGGFPGTGAWPSGIGSNRTAGNAFNAGEPGDAELIKIANGAGGGPYLASSSIYFGGFSSAVNTNGGTLGVTDATPVADLSNVVFQVQIGEAWTHDFVDGVLPTLSYNGGNQHLAATTSLIVDQYYNGTIDMPTGPEDVFINTHLLQWNLSGIAEPITAFTISFSAVQHAQVYGLRLDQSSVFTVVPAPGTFALAGLGGLIAARRRRA